MKCRGEHLNEQKVAKGSSPVHGAMVEVCVGESEWIHKTTRRQEASGWDHLWL